MLQNWHKKVKHIFKISNLITHKSSVLEHIYHSSAAVPGALFYNHPADLRQLFGSNEAFPLSCQAGRRALHSYKSTGFSPKANLRPAPLYGIDFKTMREWHGFEILMTNFIVFFFQVNAQPLCGIDLKYHRIDNHPNIRRTFANKLFPQNPPDFPCNPRVVFVYLLVFRL